MSSKLTISVVIPLYNKSYSIKRCFESVLNQTLLPNEVIVINDGSTDNSLDIIKVLITNKCFDIPIKLLDIDNAGVSSARNLGVKESTSDYVAFLDADDEWDDSFLEHRYKAILQHPSAVIYSGGHRLSFSGGKMVNPRSPYTNSYLGYVDDFYLRSLKGSIVNSSKAVILKSAFIKSTGFPVRAVVGEDLTLWMKLEMLGPVVYDSRRDVTIHTAEDKSRYNRVGKIPYPLVYFSNENLLSNQKKYLRMIFLKHTLSALLQSNKGQVKETLGIVKNTFPLYVCLFRFALFLPSSFYKILHNCLLAVRR